MFFDQVDNVEPDCFALPVSEGKEKPLIVTLSISIILYDQVVFLSFTLVVLVREEKVPTLKPRLKFILVAI